MNKNKLHLKDYMALAALIIALAAMGLDIRPDPECDQLDNLKMCRY
jgi:hypothetical protein